MTGSPVRAAEPRERASAGVFLPPSGGALSAEQAPNSGANSGGILVGEQLYFLKPQTAKVYISILNHGSREFVTTKLSIAASVGIGETTLHHALRELEDHRLIQVFHARNERGHVSGLRVRVLLPPRTLPEQARIVIRTELTRRRVKLMEEIARLDEELDYLDGVGPRPRARDAKSGRTPIGAKMRSSPDAAPPHGAPELPEQPDHNSG